MRHVSLRLPPGLSSTPTPLSGTPCQIHVRLSASPVLTYAVISGSTVINQRIFALIAGVLFSATSITSRADALEDDLAAPGPENLTPASCVASSKETPLQEQIASAGIMHNLAEHPKSIRVVAAKLLADALDSPSAHQPNACAAGCAPVKTPAVVYRVAPVTFLPNDQQQKLCLTLEKDTTAHPLIFSPQAFQTVEKLNAWVMEFSQGRGEQGQKLYAQCGGNCSPRYTFLIAQGTDGLQVDAAVVCGLARDKSSDDYTVSTTIRNRCEIDMTPLASEPKTP